MEGGEGEGGRGSSGSVKWFSEGFSSILMNIVELDSGA